MNGESLLRVNEITFVGVIINCNLVGLIVLSWLPHKLVKVLVYYIKCDIFLMNYLVYHNRSLVEPYLNYCCFIWGSNKMNVHLNRIHKLQKKSIRLITFSDHVAHSRPLTDRLNALNIFDLFMLQLYTFMYLYSQGLYLNLWIYRLTCTWMCILKILETVIN